MSSQNDIQSHSRIGSNNTSANDTSADNTNKAKNKDRKLKTRSESYLSTSTTSSSLAELQSSKWAAKRHSAIAFLNNTFRRNSQQQQPQQQQQQPRRSQSPIPFDNDSSSLTSPASSKSGLHKSNSISRDSFRHWIGSSKESIGGSPNNTPVGGFKNWYNEFVRLVVGGGRYSMGDYSESEFLVPGCNITLNTLFGNQEGHDALAHMNKVAKRLQSLTPSTNPDVYASSTSTSNSEQQPAKTPRISTDSRQSSKSRASSDSFKVQPRVLEILSDAFLPSIEYQVLGNGTRVPTKGTPEQLIDCLIFPTNQDNTYTDIILSTFHFFLTPEKLLESLVAWYNVVPSTSTPTSSTSTSTPTPTSSTSTQDTSSYTSLKRSIQSRVTKILLQLVRNHFYHFLTPTVLSKLQSFIDALDNYIDAQKLIQSVRQQRLEWFGVVYVPLSRTPTTGPGSNERIEFQESVIHTLSPEVIAQCLCVIDAQLFSRIRSDVYLSFINTVVPFHGAGNHTTIKLLTEYIVWFNRLTTYVSSVILQSKKQHKVMKLFIKVAIKCRELGDYNAFMAIVFALTRPGIVKLRDGWEALGNKYYAMVDEMCRFCEQWDTYLKEVDVVDGPRVPFLVAHIQTLQRLHATIPTYLPSSTPQINVSKLVSIHEHLVKLETYRSSYKDFDESLAWNVYKHVTEWVFVDDVVLDDVDGLELGENGQ